MQNQNNQNNQKSWQWGNPAERWRGVTANAAALGRSSHFRDTQ